MRNHRKKSQMRRFFRCLKERPKTTKMASVELGIQRANLTRYVAKFQDRGIITVAFKKRCEITNHAAKYYSTDPDYFDPITQGEMFPPPTQRQPGAYSQ